MKYYVTKTYNKYSAPQNGYNVFEIDIERRSGQSPTAIIKKILIGGLKDPRIKKMGANPESIVDTKRQVIQRIFEL